MTRRLCTLFLLSVLLIVAGCRKPPPPVAYGKLDWKDEKFLLNGQPFTGTAQDKHPNGQLKADYPMQDGKIHGVVREWWDNGQPSTETHIKNGPRHGSNRYWDASGRLLKEQEYDHDKSVSEKVYPTAAPPATEPKK